MSSCVRFMRSSSFWLILIMFRILLMRGNFFWKFAIILDSFVKCFYIFAIMMSMTFLNCATPCLIIILPIVIFSALCLFEKPRVEFFAFSPWFMHCQQGGEFCIWGVYLGIFRVFSCIPGRNLSMCNFGFWRRSNRGWNPVWPGGNILACCCDQASLTGVRVRSDRVREVCSVSWSVCTHLFRGSLHVFRGSSFWLLLWWFCSLCTDGVEPFLPPLWEVGTSFALKWSCSCLVLDFWSLVELVLFRCWFFFFLFHMVTVCVVNALIKGEIEDQERPRTSVVAP